MLTTLIVMSVGSFFVSNIIFVTTRATNGPSPDPLGRCGYSWAALRVICWPHHTNKSSFPRTLSALVHKPGDFPIDHPS